jgi:hypothetical protein
LGRQYTVHYDPREPRNYAIRDDDGSRFAVLLGSGPFFALAGYFVMMAWVVMRLPRRRAKDFD